MNGTHSSLPERKLSVIVLTFNEEKYIKDCMESLKWCKDLLVVDSGSTDATPEICRRYTDKVVHHPFKNYSTQREWAVSQVTESDWILFVDSDERVTPELAQETQDRLNDPKEDVVGYYIPHKQYFWGKWLRHGECWPCYGMKLFRKDKVRWSGREVHENTSVDGPAGFMKNPLIHIAFENITEIVEKLNRYSTLDARRMYRTGQELYAVESRSYSRLNTFLKRIFAWLPCKSVSKFFFDYIIKRGFLDGKEGFAWAVMQGFYVWLCYFKLWELKRGLVNLPDESDDD